MPCVRGDGLPTAPAERSVFGKPTQLFFPTKKLVNARKPEGMRRLLLGPNGKGDPDAHLNPEDVIRRPT